GVAFAIAIGVERWDAFELVVDRDRGVRRRERRERLGERARGRARPQAAGDREELHATGPPSIGRSPLRSIRRPTITRSRSMPSSTATGGSSPSRVKPKSAKSERLGALWPKMKPRSVVKPSAGLRRSAWPRRRRAIPRRWWVGAT